MEEMLHRSIEAIDRGTYTDSIPIWTVKPTARESYTDVGLP